MRLVTSLPVARSASESEPISLADAALLALAALARAMVIVAAGYLPRSARVERAPAIPPP